MAVPTKRGYLQLKGTAAAAEYLKERLRGLADEQFRVLYLNRRHLCAAGRCVDAQGAVDAVRSRCGASCAGPADQCHGLDRAHNHPSGRAAEPSEGIGCWTRDSLAASGPLGLRVLDHVIVAEEATYSFADSGLLDELAAGSRRAVRSHLRVGCGMLAGKGPARCQFGTRSKEVADG